MGRGSDAPANVISVQITPTRTIFVMEAGPMNVTVTFLSPIEVRFSVSLFAFLSERLTHPIRQPSDWVKQSLPFIYIYVEALPLDKARATPSVQLYFRGTPGNVKLQVPSCHSL